MERPTKLATNVVEQFVTSPKGEGWTVARNGLGHGDDDGLEKTFAFSYYGAAVAFAVHVAFAAEKRDHHPDLHLSWGKVLVRWTTHDAGGITSLDVEMAELCNHAYRR